MKESRFFEMLYGILLVPIAVIIGGTMWTFLFLAAQSNPNALLAWAAAFIVWLVFALEGLNRMIFDRRALPWLPLPGPMMPLEFRFAALVFAYGVIGFVGYKMATEP